MALRPAPALVSPGLRPHFEWLWGQARALLDFGPPTGLWHTGAAYLDDDGNPDHSKGVQAWITARTVHCQSLGSLLGGPGGEVAAGRAKRALEGLIGPDAVLMDTEHGGWFHAISQDGNPDLAAGKSAYDHAFMMLAGASATIAGIPGGRELLDEATRVYLDKFWDETAGRPVDTWNTDFTELEEYRGVNATMHSLEAILTVVSAVDAAERLPWIERAARIGAFIVELAAAHDGRLPEHFGPDWAPDLELNADRPGDQFKPYGATPGHGLEWARLLLHLEAALGTVVSEVSTPSTGSGTGSTSSLRASLLPTAVALFDRAVADAWDVDGAPGFVYTTDWNGKPVVRTRMHWVVCEAIASASALHSRTGEARYEELYRTWWEYAAEHLIDVERGSWRHELDTDNRPAATVWPGKPDMYHALQCALIPTLPLWPMLPGALRHEGSRPGAGGSAFTVLGEALVDVLPGGPGNPNGIDKPGGSPANVAVAMSRLGGDVAFVTTLADDARGQAVRGWLEANPSLHPHLSMPSTGRTSTATVTLDDEGVASYVFDLTWDPEPRALAAIADGARVLHAGSIATVLEPGATAVEAAMREARSRALITFDPNARPAITPDVSAVVDRVERLVALSDLVKASDEDLGWYYPGEEPLAVARRWAENGPVVVVVTLGGEGAFAVRAGNPNAEPIFAPSVSDKIVDTVGAGDTFMGTLVHSLAGLGAAGTKARDALTALTDGDLLAALRRAAKAAAINVARPGCDPPSADELGGVDAFRG